MFAIQIDIVFKNIKDLQNMILKDALLMEGFFFFLFFFLTVRQVCSWSTPTLLQRSYEYQ